MEKITRPCDFCHNISSCFIVKNGAACEDCTLILMIKYDIYSFDDVGNTNSKDADGDKSSIFD